MLAWAAYRFLFLMIYEFRFFFYLFIVLVHANLASSQVSGIYNKKTHTNKNL